MDTESIIRMSSIGFLMWNGRDVTVIGSDNTVSYLKVSYDDESTMTSQVTHSC